MHRTRVFGKLHDTIVIETGGKPPYEIKAEDAIVKLWFSDGTILGIKYGNRSKIWKNMWKIRVLNQGSNAWSFRQINNPTEVEYSDEYTVEAVLVNYKIIPRTHYTGDDMADDVV